MSKECCNYQFDNDFYNSNIRLDLCVFFSIEQFNDLLSERSLRIMSKRFEFWVFEQLRFQYLHILELESKYDEHIKLTLTRFSCCNNNRLNCCCWCWWMICILTRSDTDVVNLFHMHFQVISSFEHLSTSFAGMWHKSTLVLMSDMSQ